MRKSLIAMVVSLTPCWIDFAAADNLNGSWRVQSIATATAFDSSKTRFDVAEDGRVSSTVGCNVIFGKPEIDGARIGFGAMAATRRACIGPLADLETKYLAALNNVQSYHIDGATLTLLDGAGVPVVILARTK
jgi:heat shock protein HslJ